ncbi:hypothetical protein FQA47_012228 [Oryzias melastigma]|uniref:Uncharacterized protein n=1 Tax=Oryzias melastigma TaxID=30732 RepID=A0A834KY44_ORYME|nr:hypothetical protein FQA47_012228 [Oryzias melastigma]
MRGCPSNSHPLLYPCPNKSKPSKHTHLMAGSGGGGGGPLVERDGSPPLDHLEKKFWKDLLHTFVTCLSSKRL